MKDSAQLNMWWHKTVMKKFADNGGNIPRALLSLSRVERKGWKLTA
jgi:hypothetical protein